MGRSPCCDKVGLKKGTWTTEEDRKLFNYIQQNGHGSWRSLPAKAGLERCGKSCRLRWKNYLRPDIKRGQFSSEEEKTVIQLHALLGNRWSAIAAHLPKRTDNEIKNYWNTHLKKRLIKMGIDPETHKPKSSTALSSSQRKRTANLSHMAQWETARLEAEARLARGDSKLAPLQYKPAVFSPLPCLDILKAWQGKCTGNTPHPSFVSSWKPFPVMSCNESTKTSLEINDVNQIKCIIKQNDERFGDYPDHNFMEDIASVFPDPGNEDDAKYWDAILDGSTTFLADL